MTTLKTDKPVRIRVRTVHTEYLEGMIQLPERTGGFVILVNANRSVQQRLIGIQVSSALRVRGIGTLLLDLQPRNGRNFNWRHFQLDLVTQRLMSATEWLLRRTETESTPIGYFGTSFGATAALQVAASLGTKIGAVVLASGRPDLAPDAIGKILVPTLFIVAGRDHLTLEFNKEAYETIRAEKRLVIIPEATHLFHEAGALIEVSQLASDWFKFHLTPALATTVQC